MSWDNKGGGGRNNNTGGPWGQAPGGGNTPRRPSNTPNLEEILNRGRDRFQGGIPGGRWAIVGAFLALLVFWGFNAIYTIDPQEVGVQLRFGRPLTQTGPGLHFHWWPIESVERVNVTVNQTTIGTSATTRNNNDDGLMLSGDQNIVDVRFSVFWSVSDPIAYLFRVRDPDEIVRFTAESAMREVVGRRPANDVFRDDQAGIAAEVEKITQDVLNSYDAGVTITQINIEGAQPPSDVADAFNEVQRAEQNEDQLQEEARQYANTLLGNARGQAAQIREDAQAYKNRVINEATGEASRFLAVYNEYVKAPEVTKKRLFLETMEQVLGQSEKVIIESGSGQGVVPYLPLPELRSNSTTTTTTESR